MRRVLLAALAFLGALSLILLGVLASTLLRFLIPLTRLFGR